jgi:hypothetical protein
VTLGGGSPSISGASNSATVTISPDTDGLVEPDESIVVSVSASTDGSYQVGSPGSATVIVKSHDLSELSVTGGGHVYEGDTATFTITADQPVAEDTSVSFQLAGSAVPGKDYQSVPDVVVMPAGASSVTVAVVTIDNDAVFQPMDMIVGTWPARVGTVSVKVGDVVMPGAPLMTITEPRLKVTITASPSDRAKMRVGMDATVELTATKETASGKLTKLDDAATVDEKGIETYSGEVEIEGALPAVDGAVVSVDVIRKQVTDAIVVPVASLVGQGTTVQVRVVDKAGQIVRVPVETGITEDAYVEVTKGLKGNERVVVDVSG